MRDTPQPNRIPPPSHATPAARFFQAPNPGRTLPRQLQRTSIFLEPDPARVVHRPFIPGDKSRVIKVVARIMSLTADEVREQHGCLEATFDGRHGDLESAFMQRFADVQDQLLNDHPLSDERKALIGAYFTQEYALEAAALFNPSIVPHPDQSGVAAGSLRYVMSLRATGEGHISSITFRTGVIDDAGGITVDDPARCVTAGTVAKNPSYERALFLRKLHELGLDTPWNRDIIGNLSKTFSHGDLTGRIRTELDRNRHTTAADRESAASVIALARANYELDFPADTDLSERVIFPHSPTEQRGIEDARFVDFTEDDGSVTYYGTYTAVDGKAFLPQLITTRDFQHFRISTLNGDEVQNKGMALFPRKINGRYVVCSRQDNENLFLMTSDSVHFWESKQMLMRPTYPWEFIQLGNCGSPMETPEGWLLLTHGVGYMRQYCIGAALLDLDDPSRVIGRLPGPLLAPNAREREGYVPNVVYTCGGLIHGDRLIMPYAVSDQSTSFATYDLAGLLKELKAANNGSR